MEIIIKIAGKRSAGHPWQALRSVYIFNRMPARWLCDYGEKPATGADGSAHTESRRVIPGGGYMRPALRACSSGLSFLSTYSIAAAGIVRVLGHADHRPGRPEIHGDTRPVRHNAGSEQHSASYPYHSSVWQPSAGSACRRRRRCWWSAGHRRR